MVVEFALHSRIISGNKIELWVAGNFIYYAIRDRSSTPARANVEIV